MELLTTILKVTLLILVVIAIFNVIIFVHELGHFLAAKWRGLHIDRFQIWFGKPLWKKEINGVQYGLGWIPAGGFVALPQMAPMEALEGGTDREEALKPIKPIDKIIVAVAGPLFSMLLALAAAIIVWGVGKPADFIASTEVGYVEEGSPAENAGFQVGDKVLEINGEPVDGFAGSLDSVTERIILSEGDDLSFKVQRPGEAEAITLHSGFSTDDTRWFQRSGLRYIGIAPKMEWIVIGGIVENSPAAKAGLEQGDRILTVDGREFTSNDELIDYIKEAGERPIEFSYLRSGEEKTTSVTPVIPTSPAGKPPMIGAMFRESPVQDKTLVHPRPFKQVGDSLRMMYVTIAKVASPRSSIGVDHLSGPIGIAKMKYRLLQMEDGWRRVLAFMVLFNVNLAVLNMMPFPVLDGGHVTLAVLEGIARRPVKARFLEVLQMGFAIALICLMLYVTSKDIGEEFGGPTGETIEFAK